MRTITSAALVLCLFAMSAASESSIPRRRSDTRSSLPVHGHSNHDFALYRRTTRFFGETLKAAKEMSRASDQNDALREKLGYMKALLKRSGIPMEALKPPMPAKDKKISRNGWEHMIKFFASFEKHHAPLSLNSGKKTTDLVKFSDKVKEQLSKTIDKAQHKANEARDKKRKNANDLEEFVEWLKYRQELHTQWEKVMQQQMNTA